MTPSTASASSPAPALAGFFSCGRECLPAVEGDRRRQVDAGVIEPCHKTFQPRPAFGKRQGTQVGIALAEQVVGAQMDRIVLYQLRRYDLAVQPLLQHVEALHAAIANHQQLAIDGEWSMMPKSVKRFSGSIMLQI